MDKSSQAPAFIGSWRPLLKTAIASIAILFSSSSFVLGAGQDLFANAQPRLLTELKIYGPAAGRDVQGQDISRDGFIYTLQDSRGAACITKLTLSGAQVGSFSVPNVYAHQTLFIEDTISGRYLWTGSAKNSSPRLIRIKAVDGSAQVYPIDFSLSHPGRTQGEISTAYDERSGLIVLKTTMIPKQPWVFVYRMADIKANSSQARAISAFPITLPSHGSTQPLQGIATDGQFVWIRRGDGEMSSNKLFDTYTMSGQLVSSKYLAPGLFQAQGEGTKYEPEAISLFYDTNGARYMTMEMESGSVGSTIHRLFILPDALALETASRQPTVFSSALMRSTNGN